MLGKLKEKVNNVKQTIKNKQDSFNLRTLNENVFPYSCLVADDIILTKNGELMQMIEISLNDFKMNQEGGLRDKIRQAISANTNDLKTAFWIQTVKRKKAKSKSKHVIISHPLLKALYDTSQAKEAELNNYSTCVYITIIKQGVSFKLKPSYIKNYLSATFLDYKHNNYIDQTMEELQGITKNITNYLSQYNPKILGVRRGDGCEYSDLIETLYFLTNFEDKELKVVPIDITTQINDSQYLFENGIMAMQNNTTKNIRMGMSFSLKEVPSIMMANVSDIVNNTRAEMIITEYVSYVDQKKAISQFAEQKAFLQGRQDKSFQNAVGLGFLDEGKEAKYCQSSLSVMVLASNSVELQNFIAECTTMFSKHGIVMAREDISLERNYYAMLPANFGFTHRLTIHDAGEVGCFSYSYTPQESDASQLLNETVLFNIGTLKGNPVPIGLDKTKSNVMIGGNENSGKTAMANMIASALIREFNANIYIIEFKNRSRAFMEALGGNWYRISMEKQNHTAIFNALKLNLFERDDQIDNYLFELLSTLLAANNVTITPEIATEIQKAIQNIKVFSKTSKNFALHDIRGCLKDLSIDQELQCWHSIGRYYHLLDNREEVFDRGNQIAFYIDESVQDNSLVLATIINHIFTNIIQRSLKSDQPTIVICDEPFLAFGNGLYKTKLNKMLETMAKNRVYCIFKVSDLEKESGTIVDFTNLVNSCGLHIHFANKFADSNYGRVFGLDKIDYMAVKTLAQYEGKTMVIKLLNQLYSCRYDLDKYPKALNILTDPKGETQAQIFALKDALQTDKYERWVNAYFNDFNVNNDVEAQRAVAKELEAIKDIRRLLDS